MSEFNHYFKDVRHLDQIDVYRVLELFDVTDPAIQHAVKKLLCAGKRGAKDVMKDMQEAVAAINRKIEMMDEDEKKPALDFNQFLDPSIIMDRPK